MTTESPPPAGGTSCLRAAAACAVAALLAFVLLAGGDPLMPGAGAGSGRRSYWSLPDGLGILLFWVLMVATPGAVICLLVGLKLRARQKPDANILFWMVCVLMVFLFLAVI